MEEKIDEFNIKKVRDSKFELLRIFAMLIIILHHYCVHGGVFNNLTIDNITFNSILTKIMSFGKYANHIFILLTGYFMVKSKANYKKVISLILEMFFYSITISIIFYGLNIVDFSYKAFIKSLIPLLWGNWFLVYYVILYLLIPFINMIIAKIEKKQLRNIIIILTFLFIVVPTFTKNAWGFSAHDIFILDYLIGAFIRLYSEEQENNKKLNFKILVVIILVAVMSIITMSFVGKILGKNKLLQNCDYFINSNYSIISFGLAIYTFLLFKGMKIKNNKFINFIASSVLGIYLIHDNETIRNWLWTKWWPNSRFITSNFYILHMFVKVLLIFMVCLTIDKIRILIFGRLENNLSEHIYNWANKIYRKLKSKLVIKI
jgi:surface polysaccharide O-acyltransferase-like enzyme